MSEVALADDDRPRRQLATRPAPFPRERFLKFCAKVKVYTKEYGGLQQFRMLGTQRYILDEICAGLEEGITTFVILKSRQIGATTFFIILDCFWAMEHPGMAGAFATHTEQSRDGFKNTITTMFLHLPKGFKVGIKSHNRSMLVLANGSLFAYLVAGVKEKSVASLGRSGAYNFMHATEVAFWGQPDDLKELRATLATHNPNRLQIEESTANGFNHYQEEWESAVKSPTKRAIFVGWWRNELYAFAQDHAFFPHYMPDGPGSSLSALERRRLRAVKDMYGFTVTPEQIAWYRWKLDEECDGDQMKMDEMFPWLPEDAFVATGSKFFTNESLTEGMRYARSQAFVPFRYILTKEWAETQCVQVPPKQAGRAELKVWEAADPHGHYVIGADPSYGSSDEADRSVAAVYRCFADKIYQVAEFCTQSVSTHQFAWVIAHLSGYYRNVMVNLEITGPGEAVQSELDLLRRHASRLIAETAANTTGADGKPIDVTNIRNCLALIRYFLYRRVDTTGRGMLQWKMNGQNKPVLLNQFKDALELRRCLVRSLPALEECKAVVLEDGQIHGSGRAKDDRVIANALAHHAWRQWVQPGLVAQGLTLERALRDGARGGRQRLEEMVLNYLRSQNIKLPEGT